MQLKEQCLFRRPLQTEHTKSLEVWISILYWLLQVIIGGLARSRRFKQTDKQSVLPQTATQFAILSGFQFCVSEPSIYYSVVNMGGAAFKDLSTPRMPPETYHAFKNRVQCTLKEYFDQVDTPIEAVGKQDFGDLDIFTYGPREEATALLDTSSDKWRYDEKGIANTIGAAASTRVGTTHKFNFAVPWPVDLPQPSSVPISPATSTGPMTPTLTGSHEQHHIQVDIHIFSTLPAYNWLRFLHAHGDFWNIIGHMLYRYSISATTDGLFIVIPELEGVHKTLSRVLATNDSTQALTFLGLDPVRFWQPFETWDDLLAYVATCRFHDPSRGRKRDDNHVTNGLVTSSSVVNLSSPNEQKPPSSSSTSSEADTPSSANGTTLRRTDRARARKRPMFSHWLDIYRPAHADDPAGDCAHMTKAEVVEMAKAFFGEEFATQYEVQKMKGLRFGFESKLWAEMRKYMKGSCEEGHEVTVAMRAVKVVLMGKEEEWREIAIGLHGVEEVREAFGKMDLEAVMVWVVGNWKAVELRQREVDRVKGEEKWKVVKARRALDEGMRELSVQDGAES